MTSLKQENSKPEGIVWVLGLSQRMRNRFVTGVADFTANVSGGKIFKCKLGKTAEKDN